MTDTTTFEDTKRVAKQVLDACGPGRILDIGSRLGSFVQELLSQGVDAYGVDISSDAVSQCNGFMPGRFYTASILALPFPDCSFDTLVCINDLEQLAPEHVEQALLEMHRVCRKSIFLSVPTKTGSCGLGLPIVKQRGWWENIAFAAGFRKHPLYYRISPFHTLETESNRFDIPLEKICTNALSSYPLNSLLQHRDLHMDMSRETGARSDAHMARYNLAAEWVRPGDTVLDCACGLGYGTAMLAAISRGKRFLGMDIEEQAVAYARDNFGENYGIEYRQGNAEDLSTLTDASIDILVSFETLEHVPHFERYLLEAYRILKPDGRIVISVPNRWQDETGRDPNPYHHHVFDYAKTRIALETAGFTVEARYGQSAPGGFKLVEARRTLERFPLIPDDEKDTEWWILVASANPLDGVGIPYRHPDFDRSTTGVGFHIADFSRNYDNAWLYRSLIQMGERLDNPEALIDLAEKVLASASPASPDYGSALAVIGYRVLFNKRATANDVDDLLGLASIYVAQPNGNPHVLRWKISLAFLSALLALKKGDRKDALHYFAIAANSDPTAFSPLLATKTVAAWFWCGILHLGDGDQEKARRCFSSGVEAGRRALHAPDENAIGNPLDPLTFGFPELAEVADMAGQCANALHYLDDFGHTPGKFWRAVELRRFGLATWAMNLEVELKNMGAVLKQRHDASEKNREVIETLWHENSSWARIVNRMLEKLFGVRLIRMRILQRLRPDSE